MHAPYYARFVLLEPIIPLTFSEENKSRDISLYTILSTLISLPNTPQSTPFPDTCNLGFFPTKSDSNFYAHTRKTTTKLRSWSYFNFHM